MRGASPKPRLLVFGPAPAGDAAKISRERAAARHQPPSPPASWSVSSRRAAPLLLLLSLPGRGWTSWASSRPWPRSSFGRGLGLGLAKGDGRSAGGARLFFLELLLGEDALVKALASRGPGRCRRPSLCSGGEDRCATRRGLQRRGDGAFAASCRLPLRANASASRVRRSPCGFSAERLGCGEALRSRRRALKGARLAAGDRLASVRLLVSAR